MKKKRMNNISNFWIWKYPYGSLGTQRQLIPGLNRPSYMAEGQDCFKAGNWIIHGGRILQLQGDFAMQPLHCIQKELNSGKVSGLPKVKKEGMIGSEAVILQLYYFF